MADWRYWWRCSVVVDARDPLRRFVRRLEYLAAALRHSEHLQPLAQAAPGSYTARVLAKRPELLGVVTWPYLTAQMPAQQRIAHLAMHLACAAEVPGLAVEVDESRLLLDLTEVAPGLRVVLDHAFWFTREGPLVLNLFVGEERVYSLAFSLGRDPAGRRATWIGALQGRALDDALDTYRDLTKALQGMRPRDFLIEVFRMVCRAAGIVVIFAVADAARVHRARYFGKAAADKLQANYDHIWAERGGVPHNAEFFQLPVEPTLKPIDDVPSKKRAMYRRRYEMLESARRAVESAYAAGGAPQA